MGQERPGENYNSQDSDMKADGPKQGLYEFSMHLAYARPSR